MQHRHIFGVAGVLRHLGLYIVSYTPLQGRIDQPLVEARPVHVQILIVVNVLDVAAGHLQHRQTDNLVIRRLEPVPVDILQIPLVNLEVKVNSERTQMRDLLGHVPILVQGLLFVSVDSRPPVLDKAIVDPVLQRDRVGHRRLLALVYRVEHLKDLPAHKLIIPAHEIPNLIGFTVLSNRHMNIGHSSHLFLIGYQDHLVLVLLILLHEMADEGSRVVRRSVVDDGHTVVVVILVQNRLQVELVPEILSAIERRHGDTEGQLSLVLTHVVDGLEAVLLLLQLLVNLQLLHRVDETRLDVVALEDPGVAPLFRLQVLRLDQLVEFGYLGLMHHLLLVVLQRLDNGSLLPEGVVDEIDHLENGQFLLGFLLQLLPVDALPAFGLFQKFIQNLDTFIQLAEELNFEFDVLTLLLIDDLLDAGDIEGRWL